MYYIMYSIPLLEGFTFFYVTNRDAHSLCTASIFIWWAYNIKMTGPDKFLYNNLNSWAQVITYCDSVEQKKHLTLKSSEERRKVIIAAEQKNRPTGAYWGPTASSTAPEGFCGD